VLLCYTKIKSTEKLFEAFFLGICLYRTVFKSRIPERKISLRVSGHNPESSQTRGFRIHTMFTFLTSFKPLLLKGEGERVGVKSVRRGDCEYKEENYQVLSPNYVQKFGLWFVFR
jgi:hypothetical protein